MIFVAFAKLDMFILSTIFTAEFTIKTGSKNNKTTQKFVKCSLIADLVCSNIQTKS